MLMFIFFAIALNILGFAGFNHFYSILHFDWEEAVLLAAVNEKFAVCNFYVVVV